MKDSDGLSIMDKCASLLFLQHSGNDRFTCVTERCMPYIMTDCYSFY